MPTVCSASERTSDRHAPISTRNARRQSGSGTRRMPRGPPDVAAHGGARRWAEKQHFRTTYCHLIGMQHKKLIVRRVDHRPDHILKRRAREAVAAQAGIRLAHASQAPLTRPFVRNAQPRRASIPPRDAPLGLTRWYQHPAHPDSPDRHENKQQRDQERAPGR